MNAPYIAMQLMKSLSSTLSVIFVVIVGTASLKVPLYATFGRFVAYLACEHLLGER